MRAGVVRPSLEDWRELADAGIYEKLMAAMVQEDNFLALRHCLNCDIHVGLFFSRRLNLSSKAFST